MKINFLPVPSITYGPDLLDGEKYGPIHNVWLSLISQTRSYFKEKIAMVATACS